MIQSTSCVYDTRKSSINHTAVLYIPSASDQKIPQPFPRRSSGHLSYPPKVLQSRHAGSTKRSQRVFRGYELIFLAKECWW